MVVAAPSIPTVFASKLASIVEEQFTRFHLIHEGDSPLKEQIKKYWETLGFDFPGVNTPWSAVFVSFCMHEAGATKDEFEFAAAHSIFVHQAIQNALNNVGVFQGFDVDEQAANVGDIIQNNRSGNTFDFNHAKRNKNYVSHSEIVVQRGVDSQGKFAITIGGNVSDSVRKHIVRLNSDGTVKQRDASPFICIVKNFK